MAGKDHPTGISVIEQMAKKHHESSGHITRWDALSELDRKRLMDAMEAAVGVIPDELLLKEGMAADTERLAGARDALLADHQKAKRSVLYGR